MLLFNRRSSLLEVQNRALIKTAKERAARMDELERELAQATNEVERLTLERDFYSKRASTLEERRRLAGFRSRHAAGSVARRLRRHDQLDHGDGRAASAAPRQATAQDLPRQRAAAEVRAPRNYPITF